jgi:hypothetical protein
MTLGTSVLTGWAETPSGRISRMLRMTPANGTIRNADEYLEEFIIVAIYNYHFGIHIVKPKEPGKHEVVEVFAFERFVLSVL